MFKSYLLLFILLHWQHTEWILWFLISNNTRYNFCILSILRCKSDRKKSKITSSKKILDWVLHYTCTQFGSAIILYRSYLCLKKTHFVNLNAATSSVFFFIQKVISKRRSKSRLSDGTRASSENSRIIRQVICHFN